MVTIKGSVESAAGKALAALVQGIGAKDAVSFAEPEAAVLAVDDTSFEAEPLATIKQLTTVVEGGHALLGDHTAEWVDKAKAAGFQATTESIEALQSHFEGEGSAAFLEGEKAGAADFLWYGLVKEWSAAAAPRDKARLKLAMGWFGRVGKTEHFKKAAKPASPAKPTRAVNDPTRWKMVVGKVNKVWEHEQSDKLWCEEIDIGEATGPRQIGSGLKQFVSREEFEGAKVIVLANMKVKSLGGFPSHGMVVCASNEDHSAVELLVPPELAEVGDVVTFEGLTGEPDECLSSKKNADTIGSVMDILRTNEKCEAEADGHRFLVRGQPVVARSLSKAHVG